jgi:FtsZ-binding cell division protein ZapB
MDALEKLEEKINRAVALIERLNEEKEELKQENSELRGKLSEVESKLKKIEGHEGEKTDIVKEKLNGILNKLETLEQF